MERLNTAVMLFTLAMASCTGAVVVCGDSAQEGTVPAWPPMTGELEIAAFDVISEGDGHLLVRGYDRSGEETSRVRLIWVDYDFTDTASKGDLFVIAIETPEALTLSLEVAGIDAGGEATMDVERRANDEDVPPTLRELLDVVQTSFTNAADNEVLSGCPLEVASTVSEGVFCHLDSVATGARSVTCLSDAADLAGLPAEICAD